MVTATGKNVGQITQVIGSTFDAQFPQDQMPAIYNAVKVESDKKGVKLRLVGEVQQHLGGGRVRCVALGSTDGLMRGLDCVDTGRPVSVPVGPSHLWSRLSMFSVTRSISAVKSRPMTTVRSIVKLL